MEEGDRRRWRRGWIRWWRRMWRRRLEMLPSREERGSPAQKKLAGSQKEGLCGSCVVRVHKLGTHIRPHDQPDRPNRPERPRGDEGTRYAGIHNVFYFTYFCLILTRGQRAQGVPRPHHGPAGDAGQRGAAGHTNLRRTTLSRWDATSHPAIICVVAVISGSFVSLVSIASGCTCARAAQHSALSTSASTCTGGSADKGHSEMRLGGMLTVYCSCSIMVES